MNELLECDECGTKFTVVKIIGDQTKQVLFCPLCTSDNVHNSEGVYINDK
jgi:predicted nucleic acid-binding Zn ribbon protein